MPERNLKIAVIGAGAIGGVTGARMARAGLDVQIVAKHPEAAALGRRSGVPPLRHRRRQFHPGACRADRPPSSRDRWTWPSWLPRPPRPPAAAQSLLPLLQADATVVSLQNGICEQALAEVVGEARIVGCVVAWGATFHGPGRMEVTSEGEFVIGRMDGAVDARLETVAEMLSAAAPTRISTNILGELYSKLIVNSCINSLGVIAGVPLGQLLAVGRIREVFMAIMAEAVAVADAMGLDVPPGGGGKLDYRRFLSDKGPLGRLRRHLVIRIIGFKYRRIRSSSLQSLERGRRNRGRFSQRLHLRPGPPPRRADPCQRRGGGHDPRHRGGPAPHRHGQHGSPGRRSRLNPNAKTGPRAKSAPAALFPPNAPDDLFPTRASLPSTTARVDILRHRGYVSFRFFVRHALDEKDIRYESFQSLAGSYRWRGFVFSLITTFSIVN